MKITKAQLKQIIKEELEVTLTNEEAGEMFGVSVEDQLSEQDNVLNEDLDFFMQQVQDPAAWELMARALAKIITNFAPAAFGATAVMAVRRALGYDKDYEDEGQDMVGDTPVNEDGKQINEEEADCYSDYRAGGLTWEEYQECIRSFQRRRGGYK